MVPLKLTPEGAVSSTSWSPWRLNAGTLWRIWSIRCRSKASRAKEHQAPGQAGINDAWVKTMTTFASTAPTRAEDTPDEVWA